MALKKGEKKLMRYILNSAVITTPGLYMYVHTSVKKAREWLTEAQREGFISTIGYEETVNVFKELFGIDIGLNRQQIYMKKGDEALVFRLKIRLQDPNVKGKLSEEFVKQFLEIGILRKII